MNWENHFLKREYKNDPTLIQKKALICLDELHVFEDLREFKPVFAGTIPLDIDIPGSDIDIICEVFDFNRFQARLREIYETKINFLITEKYQSGDRHLVCRFDSHDFRIEIFGEKKTVTEQNGFSHMVAEAKLLKIGGEKAREEIRSLKNQGYKTEPAFAHYFGFSGDPYLELLNLAKLPFTELEKRFSP